MHPPVRRSTAMRTTFPWSGPGPTPRPRRPTADGPSQTEKGPFGGTRLNCGCIPLEEAVAPRDGDGDRGGVAVSVGVGRCIDLPRDRDRGHAARRGGAHAEHGYAEPRGEEHRNGVRREPRGQRRRTNLFEEDLVPVDYRAFRRTRPPSSVRFDPELAVGVRFMSLGVVRRR